jgi:uncharacterized protein
MNIEIHLHRINNPTRIFSESLASDNGQLIMTKTILDETLSQRITGRFVEVGLLSSDQVITAVHKYMFYGEYFAITELRGGGQAFLGYYCDIVAPLEKRDGAVHLLDLFLDLWIAPDGNFLELDWDEYQQALTDGHIEPELDARCRQTFLGLRQQAERRTFTAHLQSKIASLSI